MGALREKTRILRWGFILVSGTLLITSLLIETGQSGRANQTTPPGMREIQLGRAHPDTLYALTVWVKDPAALRRDDAVLATVRDGRGNVESKWLHSADLDFYLTLRPRGPGPISVRLSAASNGHIPEIGAALSRIPMAAAHSPSQTGDLRPGFIAALPNGNWQAAQRFEFGQTIYGSNDERPYAPSRVEDAYQAMLKGFQWFKFTFRGKEPRLVYFVLNVADRDVPLDVDIFQAGKNAAGQPDVVPYDEGEFVYQIEVPPNFLAR